MKAKLRLFVCGICVLVIPMFYILVTQTTFVSFKLCPKFWQVDCDIYKFISYFRAQMWYEVLKTEKNSCIMFICENSTNPSNGTHQVPETMLTQTTLKMVLKSSPMILKKLKRNHQHVGILFKERSGLQMIKVDPKTLSSFKTKPF